MAATVTKQIQQDAKTLQNQVILIPQDSIAELAAENTRRVNAGIKLDEAVPGGVYMDADGKGYHDCDGNKVNKRGEKLGTDGKTLPTEPGLAVDQAVAQARAEIEAEANAAIQQANERADELQKQLDEFRRNQNVHDFNRTDATPAGGPMTPSTAGTAPIAPQSPTG